MRRALSFRRSCHRMSVLVCELDVHSESTYVTVLATDGRVLAQKRMPNGLVPAFLRPYGIEGVGLETSTYIARRTVVGSRKGMMSSCLIRRRHGTSLARAHSMHLRFVGLEHPSHSSGLLMRALSPSRSDSHFGIHFFRLILLQHRTLLNRKSSRGNLP